MSRLTRRRVERKNRAEILAWLCRNRFARLPHPALSRQHRRKPMSNRRSFHMNEFPAIESRRERLRRIGFQPGKSGNPRGKKKARRRWHWPCKSCWHASRTDLKPWRGRWLTPRLLVTCPPHGFCLNGWTEKSPPAFSTSMLTHPTAARRFQSVRKSCRKSQPAAKNTTPKNYAKRQRLPNQPARLCQAFWVCGFTRGKRNSLGFGIRPARRFACGERQRQDQRCRRERGIMARRRISGQHDHLHRVRLSPSVRATFPDTSQNTRASFPAGRSTQRT